ncbi:unnamed protein product [Linum tenue]|uniref:RING-type domain-containing protein n=1 Tax=Linum tenue TaxID=586396 RepID=A0AAV0LHZ8_9ROSI|nr:unnamed protein product [Linum tenue]
MGMAGQVVKVKRAALEACMTCPLCDKLLREATTVSLCLHTFCRKCIYGRLSDDEVDTCPVCDIDLGCLPEEKLRPDHNLQDIRAKIFPSKRRKVEPATEVVTSVALPAKRKERSLSSLVVSTPKLPVETGSTGRRSKAGPRKPSGLRGCSFTTEESNKDEEEDSAEAEDDHHPISSSSRWWQQSAAAEPSNGQQQMDGNGEDDGEVVEGKADLWTPLNCLVEAANRTKSLKSNSQQLQSVANSEIFSTVPDLESRTLDKQLNVESPIVGQGGETYILHESKNKEPDQGFNGEDDDKGSNNPTAPPVKRRRLTAARRRAALSEELSASAQAVLDSTMNRANRRNCAVWFSLVASENRRGDASLPQIPACYLRIKDGKMPVSFIQKYIVKKLELSSEAEVEIMCQGQPVVPTLQLHNLVDLWFRNASTKRVEVPVGSSARDFVMVLSYCRKLHQQAS